MPAPFNFERPYPKCFALIVIYSFANDVVVHFELSTIHCWRLTMHSADWPVQHSVTRYGHWNERDPIYIYNIHPYRGRLNQKTRRSQFTPHWEILSFFGGSLWVFFLFFALCVVSCASCILLLFFLYKMKGPITDYCVASFALVIFPFFPLNEWNQLAKRG